MIQQNLCRNLNQSNTDKWVSEHFYPLTTKLREGNVFSRVFLFTGVLTVQPPPPALPPSRHGTSRQGPPGHGTSLHRDPSPLLVTSDGHHWRPVQTSSLQDPLTSTDIWWLLKQVRLAHAGGTHPAEMHSY